MKKILGCILVIILSFFAIRPLLMSGYFPMHDDTQVARVVVMGKALKQGQFPVRWVSDLGYGYGYPIFNFYGPLPYYIGGGLYALGVGSVEATKIMFGIGMVLAPITLFLLVESTWGFFAAIAAGVLFMYAPYHAVEAYIRGSVGEYWAIAFVPLIILGIYKKRLLLGSLGLAGAILSHTILGFITAGVVGIAGLMYFLKKRDWHIPMMMVCGLGLSAFFWLPAMVEISYTSVSQMIDSASTTFFDHFVCIGQLWNSPWGFAGSAPGCVDGMSFKLGKVQMLVFACALIAYGVFRRRNHLKEKTMFMLFSVLGLGFCVFLMLQISMPLWKLFPFTSYIQYPWRLLSFAMMCIAIGGAYIVLVPRMPLLRIGLMVGVVTLAIVVNAKIFVPQYVYTRDSSAFETQEELRFTKSKISDEYLPPGMIKPFAPSDVAGTAFQGDGVFFVSLLQEKDTSVYAELESTVPQTITIRKAWFPGWRITVNEKQMEPIIKHGFPSVNIPAGISIIRMQFTDTPIRTAANGISAITFILIIIFAIFYGKKINA